MTKALSVVAVFLILLLVLTAYVTHTAFDAVRTYDASGYFVRADQGQVLIYRGRVGATVVAPVVVVHTGTTLTEVPAAAGAALARGVSEPTLADARAYVTGLVATHVAQACAADPSLSTCAPPGTVTGITAPVSLGTS